MSTAAYQREWRARQGARTGERGREATSPCGTLAAYKRHLRRGEPTCQACRTANAAHRRALRHRAGRVSS